MQAWQEYSACINTDPESFFPEYNRDVDNQKEEILDALQALKICQTCPVAAQCFAYAMKDDNSISAGIYGGTLPFERQRMAIKSGRTVMGGGAPRLEQAIRRHANKQGIAVPELGVKPLNALGLRP